MIVVRAPLRISFLGGGTDLPGFYEQSIGRVICTTIDKFVFLSINRTPMIDKISVRYSKVETVDHPGQLQHTRVKAALEHFNIRKNIELASFASLPGRTGLGSSSSFSVALMKGLAAYTGKKLSKQEAAEAACDLEINKLSEPIGKQDQYASAFGGLNILEFHSDGSVSVEPLLLSYTSKLSFQQHLLLFFTGITRDTSSILDVQKDMLKAKFDIYQKMSDAVYELRDRLYAGDIRGVASLIHQGWLLKRELAPTISTSFIDCLYNKALEAGAWGGKILGAGGGGCLLCIAPPEEHQHIIKALEKTALQEGYPHARHIPFRFIQSGADILFNHDQEVII